MYVSSSMQLQWAFIIWLIFVIKALVLSNKRFFCQQNFQKFLLPHRFFGTVDWAPNIAGLWMWLKKTMSFLMSAPESDLLLSLPRRKVCNYIMRANLYWPANWIIDFVDLTQNWWNNLMFHELSTRTNAESTRKQFSTQRYTFASV